MTSDGCAAWPAPAYSDNAMTMALGWEILTAWTHAGDREIGAADSVTSTR
jgi:hypothetical protein